MSNIWNYGQYDLDRDALLKYLQSNLDSYMEYNGYDEDQKNLFRNAISDISTGITNGTITGNGYNKFHDSTGTIEKNDITAKAFGYINTVANAMGKKFGSVKKEEKKEKEVNSQEQPTLEIFDIKKHGFLNFFMSKENPFNQQLDWETWKKQYPNIGMLRGKLIDMINDYREKYNNFSNMNFDNYSITSDQYLNMLNSLEEDLTNGISDSDKQKLLILGAKELWDNVLNSSSEEYLEQLSDNEENQQLLENSPSSFLETFNKALFSDTNTFAGDSMLEESKKSITDAINNLKLIIQNHLKNFYKDKYDSENIDKELEELLTLISKNLYHSKKLSELIAGKGSWWTRLFAIPTDQYKKIYNRLILSGLKDKEVKEMLFNIGAYKEGGIIKAQTGIETPILAPDWYKKFYGNRTSLLGWTRNKNSQNWITDEHTFHGNADSLDTVYQANKAYTDDLKAVTNDILSYYKSGENISDFINRYNSDSAKLRATWETDLSYNGNAAEHNPLFRNMFASRSKTLKGDPLYNLNYQEDLLHTIGSTTWHRRMDTYEKEWEDLTDAEKLKRMHSIKLGNDSNAWVYKKANGDIAQIEDLELERLLKYYPEFGEEVQTPNNTGQDHEGAEEKLEKVEVPKPEKPNDSFFTPDKALAALNYFRAIGHNKKLLDLVNRIVPLLYDPVEHHRYVYGDLGAIAKGLEAAGQVRSLASKPLTSDGSLATAQRLEGENLARLYILQGYQSDNETMRKMSELAWQQEKENRENRYNIAMKNRENMHQVSKEKLMALMGKERSDYESLTNHINEWRTWLTAKQKADSDKANLLYNRRLLNWVQNNPQEYIPNWNLYEGVWNRYNNGETLTANELRTIQQILSRLAEAYYSELYGKGDYFGYGITRAPWEAKFAKGGRLTKSQVDTVIKFLKESNNNYNKAVDRSVRGLYNHIKLQRKK